MSTMPSAPSGCAGAIMSGGCRREAIATCAFEAIATCAFGNLTILTASMPMLTKSIAKQQIKIPPVSPPTVDGGPAAELAPWAPCPWLSLAERPVDPEPEDEEPDAEAEGEEPDAEAEGEPDVGAEPPPATATLPDDPEDEEPDAEAEGEEPDAEAEGEEPDAEAEGEEPDVRNRTSVKLRRTPNAIASVEAIMTCLRIRRVCLPVSKSFTTAPSLTCA
jgi:hypothetical protein